MTWEITTVVVAALVALVAGLWVSLPYMRKRSDERVESLEKAAVELQDRLARLEQAEVASPMPRGLPRVGMSR